MPLARKLLETWKAWQTMPMPKYPKKDGIEDLMLKVKSCLLQYTFPAKERGCIIAASGMLQTEYNIEFMIVYRYVAWVKFTYEGVWRKYILSKQSVLCAKLFDQKIFDSLIKKGEMSFKLLKPTGVRKAGYTRSEEFKTLRKQSLENRKGKTKRAYRTPHPKIFSGQRGGHFGYHVER